MYGTAILTKIATSIGIMIRSGIISDLKLHMTTTNTPIERHHDTAVILRDRRLNVLCGRCCADQIRIFRIIFLHDRLDLIPEHWYASACSPLTLNVNKDSRIIFLCNLPHAVRKKALCLPSCPDKDVTLFMYGRSSSSSVNCFSLIKRSIRHDCHHHIASSEFLSDQPHHPSYTVVPRWRRPRHFRREIVHALRRPGSPHRNQNQHDAAAAVDTVG